MMTRRQYIYHSILNAVLLGLMIGLVLVHLFRGNVP